MLDEAIFKIIGEAVKGGYALPFIAFYVWDKWKDRQDRKEEKEEKRRQDEELERKKKSGEYVSYQDVKSLKEQVNYLNVKVDDNEKDAQNFRKQYDEFMQRENLEEGRFVKLES